jgi:two-component system sensor histidine kinase/response regulator
MLTIDWGIANVVRIFKQSSGRKLREDQPLQIQDNFIVNDTNPISANILIVDDHLINRELMRNVLEREHNIFSAGSVKDARPILEAEAIDLILLDIMMPGVSGLEWLEELRDNPRTKRLPIILVTALSDTQDIVRGLDLGANDYISKPLDMRVLIARVRSHLVLKRLMDERENTINKLVEVERLRSNLFRIVSHDLKNPLNNIRMAEHILREKSDQEAHLPFLNTIKTTVDAMQYVIDDFLQMIELDSDSVKIDLAEVSLRDVFNDSLAQYEVSAKNKAIHLTAENTDLHVIADYSRLRQALNNLVSNAIKYSPQDRAVTIRCQQGGDGMTYIAVQDQGPGIKPEEREQLFKEFGSTSNRPTDNETSTGLGLWIVAHLMEIQNGQAGVDFPAEGGSVFWLAVPST